MTSVIRWGVTAYVPLVSSTSRRIPVLVLPLFLLATAVPAMAARTAAAPSASETTSLGTAAAVARAADDDRGRWRVVDHGSGHFAVSWTSPTRLSVVSDRPTIGGDDLAFGPSTIGDDGRTVRANVVSEQAPDPAVLDVVLSGDRLDERGTDVASGAAASDATPAGSATPAAPDPALPGPYDVVTSDYDLPGVKVPGMRRKIEMIGHVVEPDSDAATVTATGPRPLVLLMHGRHSTCYDPADADAYGEDWPCQAPFAEIPSHLGYGYIQQTLASHGYATVSIRVNGINAQDDRLDDGGADARAILVEKHLDYWTRVAAAHRVDLDQVVLVGHSRGGEGVDRASIQIPADAPYRVAGQVLLAPTDFASHTAPYVPTVTVLPYCDGDVSDLQGQKFTDTARDVDTVDPSLKSSVLVLGANHNFFNTEWTPGIAAAPSNDDWSGPARQPCGRRDPGRLDAAEQRSVGTAYVAGAVKLFLGDDAYLPMFDGSQVSVPSAGDAVVYSHAIGGGRDVRRPGREAFPSLATDGASGVLCRGEVGFDPTDFSTCSSGTGATAPHWRFSGERNPTRAWLQVTWSQAGASAGLALEAPLDLTDRRLELRTIIDRAAGDPELRVRVVDGSGASAVLVPDGGESPPTLPQGGAVTKLWAQAVIVDPSGASGVDLSDVTEVDVVGDSASGHLWIADVSSAPAALAPVPDVRLPQVEIGQVTIPEGNRPGVQVARVPFDVVGNLTRSARFQVFTAGQERGSTRRFVVDVAPGQTHGSIPVAYEADRLDDLDTTTQVTAWPLRGLSTDDYLGSLDVQDDDPSPKLTVRTVRPRITEGQRASWKVQLSRPVGYDLYVESVVVRGTGTPLRGLDVTRSWFGAHADPSRRAETLASSYVYTGQSIRSGKRTARISIPTARDRLAEGTETLTLRIRSYELDRTFTRTVRVRDAG